MAKTVAPPHDLWKVARVNVHRLPDERRRELIAWVVEVSGLPREEVEEFVRPELAVTQGGNDKSYRLHLSRLYRDGEGRMVIDHAANQLQIEPLVFPVTEFPAWLPAVSHQQENGDT